MPDIESWIQGTSVLGLAERELRIGTGSRAERLASSLLVLAQAEPELFPDFLWENIQDVVRAGKAVRDDRAFVEFADSLAAVRDLLDLETSGATDRFLTCPRCALRLIDGTIRISGGVLAGFIGKAAMSVRFQPEGKGHVERTITPLDAVRGFVCPACEAVVLDSEPAR